MATRYWVIAPFDSTIRDIWEKVWQFDLTHNVISIGWRELGDISAYSEDELKAAIEQQYGNTRSFNMLWDFYHSVKEGDIVIARKGRKKIASIGTVTKSAYFDKDKNLKVAGAEYYYPNHIDINWHDNPRDKVFDRIIFGMQTIYETSAPQYQELLIGEQTEIESEPEQNVENKAEFVLEKYLEDFIVSNFTAIFKNELVLYRDPEENVIGQQYTTDVGRIDILAQESKSSNFTVIELKKGRESDIVVGQTLRYMGWVQENLCKNGQTVKGLIICKDIDTKMSYALKMTNNIEVKLYQVDFALRDTKTK
jgi:restriction system protein